MRSEVNDLLQACLQASTKKTAIEIQSEDEDEEMQDRTSKRPRSKEPHGAARGAAFGPGSI